MVGYYTMSQLAEWCPNEKMGIQGFLDDLLSVSFLKEDKMPGERCSLHADLAEICHESNRTMKQNSQKDTSNIFMTCLTLFNRKMVSENYCPSLQKRELGKVVRTIKYSKLLLYI